MLFLRIELLDERSDTRGNGSRERVVVGPQALPERQPDVSIANEGRLISRRSVHQRLVGSMRCRCARERRSRLLPFCRLRLIGTKFARAVAKRMLDHVPADPGVEAVGRPNRGVETVLDRRRRRLGPRRLGPMRSPAGPADCRHGDAPFGLCFSHRSNRAAARANLGPLLRADDITHGR